MRLPGRCEACGRQTTVRVTGHAMMAMLVNPVPIGLCDECDAPRPRARAVPLSEIKAHPNQSLLPRDYLEGDDDQARRT